MEIHRAFRLAALPGALFALAVGCGPTPPREVSFVLVSLDTLRPDRLSCYGAPRETSPAIDGLAAIGARFARAYSTAPWTLPAHASLLSGRYPSTLSPKGDDDALYRAGPSLPETLREAGYATGAVTGGAFVSADLGADRGFDDFFEGAGVEDAIRWLRERGSQPFFLFFHTYVAHAPYKDKRFVTRGSGGRIREIYRDGELGDVHFSVCGGELAPSAEEHDYLVSFYDGGVALADEMVSRILAALADLGLETRTVVVITSDHGEEFWEHTGRGAYHGHSLYDELLRIPLVWYDPDLREGGRVIEAPVSLVDVAPTLLARAGLTPPEELEGMDLGSVLAGSPLPERPLFAESVRHGPPRFAIRTLEGKLVWTPEPAVQRGEGRRWPLPEPRVRELFLASDESEAHDTARSHGVLADELHALLQRHLEGADLGAEDDDLVVSPETRRQLEELGYVE